MGRPPLFPHGHKLKRKLAAVYSNIPVWGEVIRGRWGRELKVIVPLMISVLSFHIKFRCSCPLTESAHYFAIIYVDDGGNKMGSWV